MLKLVLIARPRTEDSDAYLLVNDKGSIEKEYLSKDEVISLHINRKEKYCTGWYDIETHTNHLCDLGTVIEDRYDSCFICREKTGFNPAFYNTTDISAKQATYNETPHSVYIAYFGNGLAKAGIKADSRGLERLYEQGALFYTVIGTYPSATMARNVEVRLIGDGLKSSITKNQKAKVFSEIVNVDLEKDNFTKILSHLGHADKLIVNNVSLFFFGEYPRESISNFTDENISGKVRGIVGRYLILENNERFYGFWLNSLYGYRVVLGSEVREAKRELQQMSFL